MTRKMAKSKSYRKTLIKQKLMGFVLIAISVLILVVASNGRTIEKQDSTVFLFLFPLGIALLFSKKILITV